MKVSLKPVAYVFIPVAIGYCAWAAFKHYKQKKKHRYITVAEAFNKLHIRIVSSENECDPLIDELERRCYHNGIKALGMDCEWVQRNGSRAPVALLQLSTFDGLCVLFQLRHFKTIPRSLHELLSNDTIYKLGVAIANDAKYLLRSYNLNTKSYMDLRYVSKFCGYNATGLATLAKNHLNIILPKESKIVCSDWEAKVLSEEQILYAAADAHVGIKIFHKLLKGYKELHSNSDDLKFFNMMCSDNRNMDYKHEERRLLENIKSGIVGNYTINTLTRPLYDNCMLQAPDGRFLCALSKKRATWYLKKQLGVRVSDEPFTVRLLFEPAGRMCTDDYRLFLKENICVVCGSTKKCVRKNVVPRQYRKHFPAVIKDSSSFDVVLLCVKCHQISNIHDTRFVKHIGRMCGVMPDPVERPSYDKRSQCARALLRKSAQIPESRREELKRELLKCYPECTEVTAELLEEASRFGRQGICIPAGSSHGEMVVKYYLEHGGLLKLEEDWRQHFIDTMKPAYLPNNWSLKQGEERLYVNYKQGRLQDSNFKSIGFQGWTIVN